MFVFSECYYRQTLASAILPVLSHLAVSPDNAPHVVMRLLNADEGETLGLGTQSESHAATEGGAPPAGDGAADEWRHGALE
jgi:hypothetical protein